MNKVTLMGRICKDIEVKYGSSGTAFASFTLAVNRSFTKAGEEKKSDFLNCKVFSKTAENIAKFFSKGSMIVVTGRIETGSYEKDGNKVYTTNIMVDEFFFTEGKKSDNGQTAMETEDEHPF